MEEQFIWMAVQSPTFGVYLGGALVRAKDGVLKLDAGQNSMLVELMKDRPDIAANLKKIDLERAKQTVLDHQQMRKQAAVRGPFASTNPGQQTINDARQAQKSENLTGRENPTHIDTRRTLEVQEMPIPVSPRTTPGVKGGLAGRLGRKN